MNVGLAKPTGKIAVKLVLQEASVIAFVLPR
jgi:hypothetical protein